MRDNEGDGAGDGGGCGPTTMRTNDAERLREMQLSIAASSSVFPGFKFSPTDDELISYYLKKKLQGCDDCVDIIPEVDFCLHEPWDLPGLSIIRSENEWFFFSARGKKYPNGSQSKRATQSGYWKATGKERNVKSGVVTIGTKRTLVFHTGRAPKGERTEWIMHEYCVSDTTQESLVVCRLRRNGDFRLNEYSRGSSGHRNISATDNGHSGTNEYANNTPVDGFNACSKESTSSYRSHSVEHNDSESESNRHESPDGSSSPLYKDDYEEDDCFADIINDDIIKLDESGSHSFTFHGVLAGPTKCTQKLPQETMSSVQGTAVRRIKLRRNKVRRQHDVSRKNQEQPSDEKKSPGCVVSVMAGTANTVSGIRSTRLILVFLFLLILFVVWQGNHFTSRRQLRYWLHKAADYI